MFPLSFSSIFQELSEAPTYVCQGKLPPGSLWSARSQEREKGEPKLAPGVKHNAVPGTGNSKRKGLKAWRSRVWVTSSLQGYCRRCMGDAEAGALGRAGARGVAQNVRAGKARQGVELCPAVQVVGSYGMTWQPWRRIIFLAG